MAAGLNLYQFAPNVWKWIDPLGLCNEKAQKVAIGFYVSPDDQAIPSRGYRAIGGDSNIAEALEGSISLKNPTYITFDNITNMSSSEAKDLLQLPVAPSHAVDFSTGQILDDLSIPTGRWNTTETLEPLAKTFPEWGRGGGTQAITNLPIEIDGIVKLK